MPAGDLNDMLMSLLEGLTSGGSYSRARQRRRERLKREAAWRSGGRVDDKPAVTRKSGDRTEALWGGKNPRGDGEGHGHIVTNDGLNAAYVRYPDEDEPFVDDVSDKRQR